MLETKTWRTHLCLAAPLESLGEEESPFFSRSRLPQARDRSAFDKASAATSHDSSSASRHTIFAKAESVLGLSDNEGHLVEIRRADHTSECGLLRVPTDQRPEKHHHLAADVVTSRETGVLHHLDPPALDKDGDRAVLAVADC